ncbi:MAG: 2-amino-4-hydroxy-6-hydroxymethyldihydropteridine diphosphokinase [Prevotella sp.]|nr:2-amino-4-hydroxy-6-hydroxymethyldihydropteridine diphosphokinase [Prevotella sp.]
MVRKLLLSLGSNTEQSYHIATAQQLLRKVLGDIHFTRSMWTIPIGSPSPLYLNCLAYGETALTYSSLLSLIKDIERQMGRLPQDKSLHLVKIDIDILQLDSDIYHSSDWNRPYVQSLLKDIWR